MKIAITTLLVSALGALSATGQALTSASASVDLTTVGVTTVVSTFGHNGFVASIGCTVSNPLTLQQPTVNLEVTLGNSSANYVVYSGGYWQPTLLPYLRLVTGGLSTWGESPGDSFLIPIGVAYSNDIYVYVSVGVAAGTGTMICTVNYS